MVSAVGIIHFADSVVRQKVTNFFHMNDVLSEVSFDRLHVNYS